MNRISKENYYLNIAQTVLERATCLRRVYGAIIVKNDEIISTGYNGSPRGRKNCVDMGFCTREAMQVPRGERYELCRSVHAEANAIISASRRDMVGGTLYLVATPIGNLGDFSPRAAETLGAVDFIAAEDTRVSVKLLNHFQIKKPLVSYHEHNHAAAGQAILQRLLAGESCALVTDAGTPAISDPGEDLVRLCAENGVEVLSIPGCCAAVNALAVSGLPTGRFTFEGFLTVNKKSRRERLDSLKNEERTMIFHEAPHKLRATLEDLRETFGPDRRVALCRELTKLHEETVRTTLGEAAAYYQENTPKGEYVLVVAGSPPRETAAVTLEEGTEQVLRLVAQGIRLKDAAREVSAHTGLSKNELYAAALERS